MFSTTIRNDQSQISIQRAASFDYFPFFLAIVSIKNQPTNFFFFHNGKQFLLENLIGGCFVFFFMLYLFFSLKLHVTDLANCSPAEPCRFNLAANEISTFRLFHRRDTPTRSDPTVSVFLSISLELGTSFFFFFFFFCQRT